MGTHFGHLYKNFDPCMSHPIEKEHHTQILIRIGPTIGIKCGNLDFGLMQPRRSDLISSGPPFWGVPKNFYFMQLFDRRPPSAQKNHFSVLGIKWAPILGTHMKNVFLGQKEASYQKVA